MAELAWREEKRLSGNCIEGLGGVAYHRLRRKYSGAIRLRNGPRLAGAVPDVCQG